ncbi:MAG: hypothetical protein FJX76_14995 [Armatimonadetes bacterium]|nr:hypothetical protein [Armatimonadota bacterium]
MISSVRPTLLGTTPAPAPRRDEAAELFGALDEAIPEMHDALVAAPLLVRPQLVTASALVKDQFMQEVLGISALPALAEECHHAAIAALAAGLTAGAIDNVLLLTALNTPAPAVPPAPAPVAPTAPPATNSGVTDELKEKLDALMAELAEAATKAQEQLKVLGPRALQATSYGQKRLASGLLDQAERFADHPNTPVSAYQAYLASMYALGHGIAANDVVLTVVANQAPQQYP